MAAQGVEMMIVQINIQELMQTLKSISQKSPQAGGSQVKGGSYQYDESQQICGLSSKDYHDVITLSKYRCLSLLPVIFQRFGNVCLPFIIKDLPPILQQMIGELATSHSDQPAMTSNLNKVFDLYTFGNHLLQLYGMNSIHTTKMLFFHDIDHFNIVTMAVNLVRCIVQKRDQTVIDLQFKSSGGLGLGAGGMLKAGKVLQKVGGHSGQENLANVFM